MCQHEKVIALRKVGEMLYKQEDMNVELNNMCAKKLISKISGVVIVIQIEVVVKEAVNCLHEELSLKIGS